MTLTRRRFTQGLMAATATAGLSACMATNPATGRTSFTGFYDLEDDVRMGRQEAPRLSKEFGGAYEDARIRGYVSEIGRRLAAQTEFKQLPYEFTVLNSPIVNAFALPGGFVFISRGLLALASNEAEVASVLAHELGHVNARHTAERLSKGMLAQLGLVVLGVATGSRALTEMAQYGATAYIQSFSRDQEFEADMLGVRYMTRAGYDPEASATFLATLREHSMLEAEMMGLAPGSVDEFNIMSTHPRTLERLRRAMQQAEATRVADARIGREDYMGRLNGLLYGDDPEQGMVQGRRFVHPVLRFEYEVPEGFRLINGQQRVVAKHNDGPLIIFDMGEAKQTRDLAAYIEREWAPDADLRELETLTVNGLPAATGVTRGSSRDLGQVDIRLLAIGGDGSSVFRFMFVTPAQMTAALNEPLRRTTYSFRRLSESEAGRINAMRLLVVPASRGDSVPALARTLPFGDRYNEKAFRIMNDLEPDEPLAPGRLVKVVAA